LATSGYLAAANFTEASRVCVFTADRPKIIPAYQSAAVEVIGGTSRCRVSLGAWAACLLEAPRTLRLEGDARIDTTLDGVTCIRNMGSGPVHVEVISGAGAGKKLSIASDGIAAI
jgi:hypothetical protein